MDYSSRLHLALYLTPLFVCAHFLILFTLTGQKITKSSEGPQIIPLFDHSKLKNMFFYRFWYLTASTAWIFLFAVTSAASRDLLWTEDSFRVPSLCSHPFNLMSCRWTSHLLQPWPSPWPVCPQLHLWPCINCSLSLPCTPVPASDKLNLKFLLLSAAFPCSDDPCWLFHISVLSVVHCGSWRCFWSWKGGGNESALLVLPFHDEITAKTLPWKSPLFHQRLFYIFLAFSKVKPLPFSALPVGLGTGARDPLLWALGFPNTQLVFWWAGVRHLVWGVGRWN